MRAPSNHQSRITAHHRRCGIGFTTIEMIVVIVITGIIGSVVAVFMRRPVEAYVDASRRAELTDIADTALRRITRDLRRALPNSIRVTPVGVDEFYLEYLQTTGGGRYRSDVDSGGLGNPLDFTGDTSFDVLGPMPTDVANNDRVVVYNLGPGSGSTDAYTGGNTAIVKNVAAPTIEFTLSKIFPFASPGKRFQTISGPVTYFCNPDATNGVLRRISGYAEQAGQPTNVNAAPLSDPPPVINARLATSVTACQFVYTAVSQRTGSVAIRLEISRDGETVQLFQQVNINNVP
jgi:MSHA biogenesis protein MshO